MPDYSIASQVNVPAPAFANPIELANAVTTAQRNLIETQTARQTLAAKGKAGAIMASAPDLDAGIHALLQDPSVSGYAPDIIATLQGVSQAQLQMQGEAQTQAQTGLQAAMHGLLPALNDPSTFDANIAAQRATLSPTAQRALDAAVPSLKAALLDGLPSDPAAAMAKYQQRLGAMMVGSGLGPDGIRAVTGTMAPSYQTVTGPEGQQITLQTGGPITGNVNQPPVLAEGPTTSAAARLAGEGNVVAGIEGDLSDASANLPTLISTIHNTVAAMDAMQPGGGADIRAGLGKALQFFKNAGATGITDDLINKVANGNLAATQTLQAMLRNFVTGQLREASKGTGAGRIKSEVDAFLQSADSTTDPAALRNIFNAALQHLQIDYDMSQEWPKFKKAVQDNPSGPEAQYGLPGFYAWYNANKLNLNLLPTVTPGGQTLITPEGQGGGASSGPKSLKDIFGE